MKNLPQLPPIEATDANGCGLRIEFHWIGDRFAHTIQAVVDGVAINRGAIELHSVESEADESWPLSPPLQQISIESIDGQPTALAVGAAGRCHWSMSVSPAPHEDHPALRFDIAARREIGAEDLGSLYAKAWSIAEGTSPSDAIRQDVPELTIVPLSNVAPCLLMQDDLSARLVPAIRNHTTVRWAYVVTAK